MRAAGLPAPARRRWLIRAAGSALLLAALFWLLPAEAIGAAFRKVPPGVFAAVLALFLLAHAAAAMKWRLLTGPGLRRAAALRAHYAGLAANLCLPGAAGGDVVRAGLAQAELKDGARVAAAAAADRLIDMAALLAVAGFGLALTRSAGAEGAAGGALALQAALILAALIAAAAALPWLLPLPWKLWPGLPGRGFAARLATAFAGFGARPGHLALAFLASAAIQLALVLLAWWLARAAGAGVAPGPWLLAWPLAKIIAVLPVSLNGLGLREATLAGFLAPFGADPAVIVAAGLMWQAVLFAAGGTGALVLALNGRAVPLNTAAPGKDPAK
ncbi:lysylphosphatidylglycerol synthase transmembrane domain-containing protein (plasmid) [Roseobacteraceae bacterium NS-SX3]